MTDLPERFDLASQDPLADKLAALRSLFPGIVRDDKVDVQALIGMLGDWAETGPERFGLTWPGKVECTRVIQEPSNGTLVPMREESVDFDATQNVIIEGDNLEVLKLLQKAYYGKVGLIYIDPPYNTGNDFIYPDKFHEGLQDYLRFSGQVGDEGFKFSANTETDGRYHSKWLSMMYPRLFLARNLLADSAIIAIQIGDVELAHLRDLMDELFGEENYINTLSVKTKVSAGASGGGEDRRLKKNVEFILLYAKDLQQAGGFAKCYTEEPLMDVIADMRDANQSWKYTSVLTSKGQRRKLTTVADGSGNPIDIYVHDGIERTTIRDLVTSRGTPEAEIYKEFLKNAFSDTNAQSSIRTRVIDAAGPLEANQMYSVEYVPASGREKGQKVTHYYISNTVRRVIWLSDIAYVDENGEIIKKERTGTLWDDIKYNNLGKEGGVTFPNGKKPVELIERIIDLVEDPDALVLDFFAGSGTTAHALFCRNIKDGGSRQFILVQLPEPTADEEFGTITSITRERVRRTAGELSVQQLPLGSLAPDLGFKAFKLAASNFRVWNSRNAETNEVAEQLELATNNLVDGPSHTRILIELLLKAGYRLTDSVDVLKLKEVELYSVADGSLLVCLSQELSIDLFERMVELDPAMILVLDAGFGGSDELKVNALQTVRARNQRNGSDIVLQVV